MLRQMRGARVWRLGSGDEQAHSPGYAGPPGSQDDCSLEPRSMQVQEEVHVVTDARRACGVRAEGRSIRGWLDVWLKVRREGG